MFDAGPEEKPNIWEWECVVFTDVFIDVVIDNFAPI
jgi:hypothetical protein